MNKTTKYIPPELKETLRLLGPEAKLQLAAEYTRRGLVSIAIVAAESAISDLSVLDGWKRSTGT